MLDGPNAVLINAKYSNRADTKSKLQGVKIGKAAVIVANVTILPGVSIGEGAIVGAGTAVTSDVLAATIIYNHVLKHKNNEYIVIEKCILITHMQAQ